MTAITFAFQQGGQKSESTRITHLQVQNAQIGGSLVELKPNYPISPSPGLESPTYIDIGSMMATIFDPEEEKKAIYETLPTLVHSIDTGDVATPRSLMYPKGRVALSQNGQISYFDCDEFEVEI
jgi:hypothetical protein